MLHERVLGLPKPHQGQLVIAVVSVGLLELALIYLLPVLVAVVCWLGAAVWVYGLAVHGRNSRLRGDLEHRVKAKQLLPSGAHLRLSFGYVAFSLLGDNCVQATVLYRLSHWLTIRRRRPLARFVQSLGRLVTHTDISPDSEIGPGFYLYHGDGVVIGKGTRIGRNAIVCQNVTTGGGPTIGNDVKLWAGAKVIGRVSIGDRSEVGANGVVISDVPSDVIAVGVPATRFLQKDSG